MDHHSWRKRELIQAGICLCGRPHRFKLPVGKDEQVFGMDVLRFTRSE